MVDAAGPRKKSGGVGVRKKSRVSMILDMTPMVDIAFLLVIFFMTTTRFREPQAIEITLPQRGKPKKTKQSNVMVLTVDAQGKLTHKIGDDEPALIEIDSLEPLLLQREVENIRRRDNGPLWADSLLRLRSLLRQRPGHREYEMPFRMIKEDISKLTVLIQVDPRSRYKSVIQVMDAVNAARMARFSVVRLGTLEEQSRELGAPATPAPAAPGPTGMNPGPAEYQNTRRT
jgi:biopolymer transport protein ExbD